MDENGKSSSCISKGRTIMNEFLQSRGRDIGIGHDDDSGEEAEDYYTDETYDTEDDE